jgi:hypothetical protein
MLDYVNKNPNSKLILCFLENKELEAFRILVIHALGQELKPKELI